jgi:S-adenosylmethionine:tRNA ribosyltransferase-isomerase
MDTRLFDFHIPDERIALYPTQRRESCKLMVVDRATKSIDIIEFNQLGTYLHPGDIIVLNNSKVLACQLFARRQTGGEHEILLTKPLDSYRTDWEALIKRSKKLKPGDTLYFDSELHARIIEKKEDGRVRLHFNLSLDGERLEHYGNVPLPPYIKKMREWEAGDAEWYQTVYAKEYGSIASPTAGLHFSESLIQQLIESGVYFVTITLHVSIGTFRLIQTDQLENHWMDTEFFKIDPSVCRLLNTAISDRRRIIATGTTVTRTLESAGKSGVIESGEGQTNLFITPGYDFSVISGMITNFHLPRSTPLVLVCSLAGFDLMKRAYDMALTEGFRFFSYGDAMLII